MDKIKPELQMYDRTPDYNVKHAKGFNPFRYISIQDRVNNDSEFEIAYINKLVAEGWFKLEDNRSILKNEMKGRHFKYRLNGNGLSNPERGTFRSGGIIIGRKEEADDYIMYKAYNGCLFPLQMNDIEEIYVKDPNVKIDGNRKERVIKTTVFFKEPEHETRFPVFLQSRLTGDNIVVHYAKDNYKRERFVTSKKYQYAFKTGDWGFE
tara:strand:- start:6112 stop:6735 length:624 start_codon:yes stop_codon:yes gene_type:complete